MWVLIVIGLFVGSGPMSHRSGGAMTSLSTRLKSETACNKAKDKILAEAEKKGASGFVIVICEKDE